MRRSLWKSVLGLGLLGCGGQPNADLWVVWKATQESLDQEVDLNSAKIVFRSARRHSSRDSRALEVMPHQLKVSAEPDVTAGILLAATGLERSIRLG